MILFGDFDVGEILVRVPLERDRAGNRKREVTFCNKQARFDVKCVAGIAPAVTVPDEIFHRHAFEAATEAKREAVFRPEDIAESKPREILVGHRVIRVTKLSEREKRFVAGRLLHAIAVTRVNQIDALRVSEELAVNFLKGG